MLKKHFILLSMLKTVVLLSNFVLKLHFSGLFYKQNFKETAFVLL